MRDGEREDRRRLLVRDALHRAGDVAEPRLDRLKAAMPGLIDEAARRRAAHDDEMPAGILDQLVPLSWRALPGFAAATLVLVVLSSAAYLAEGSGSVETAEAIELDRLLLTGETSRDASHPFIESWLSEVNDDG